MGLTLPRYLGAVDDLPAGMYVTDSLRHAKGAALVVAVACPKCRGVTDVAPAHVIARGGKVTPAFRCPTETCGFVEWLELEGFGEPVRP